MSLFQKIKNLVAGLTLLGSVVSTDLAKADEYKLSNSNQQTVASKSKYDNQPMFYDQTPKRSMYLQIVSNNQSADPRNSFEANTSAWDSANELIGKGSDYLGTEIGLDNSISGRIALSLGHAYLTLANLYASHETSHNFLSRKKYEDSLEFDLGGKKHGTEQFLFFKNKSNTDGRIFNSVDDTIFSMVSGFNQQEQNLDYLYEKFAKQDAVFFDQGMAFLWHKVHPIKYIIEAEDPKNQESILEWGYNNPDKSTEDPTVYRLGLKEKGINISKKELLFQNIIPAALTFQTYHSIASFCGYFGASKRAVKPFWIELDNAKITPPLFSHYFTPDGSFWNADLFIKPKNGPLLEAELGIDINFLGESKLDRFRIGGKVHDISIFSKESKWSPKISPYAYLNFARSKGSFEGFLVGSDIELPFAPQGEKSPVSFVVKTEISGDDVIENTVKGEEASFNLSMGFRIRF